VESGNGRACCCEERDRQAGSESEVPWGRRKGWLHVCFLSSLGRPVTGKGKARVPYYHYYLRALTHVCLSFIN
jgi:hypothetical protein